MSQNSKCFLCFKIHNLTHNACFFPSDVELTVKYYFCMGYVYGVHISFLVIATIGMQILINAIEWMYNEPI